MTIPFSADAKLFFRAALQRYDDAEVLLGASRTTGAIYLAGYAVECALKALILSYLGAKRRAIVLESFRGNRGHNLESLREQFQKASGTKLSRAIAEELSHVSSWTTDMRYETGTVRMSEAKEFLRASQAILIWMKEKV
jgi:HEPN domain-containing protein